MSTRTINDVHKRIKAQYGRMLPIVEAKENLRLQPEPCDAKGADAQDPSNCLLVHTAKRQFGCRAVVFWKTSAYLDLLAPNGQRRVERFVCSKKTRELIQQFDQGQKFKIGTAITLIAPAYNDRLDVKRKQSRISRKANPDFVIRLKAVREVRVARQTFERVRARTHDDTTSPSLVKAAARLAQAQEAAARLAQPPRDSSKRPRNPHTVDLHTRNGALGRYKFAKA
jgi:hypothetical protein